MTQENLFEKDPSSSQADIPASPSVQVGKGEVKKILATSSRTLQKLLHKQDPLTAFSRMFMDTFRLDSTKLSAKWDHLITPHRHLLFQLRVSAHIKEIGSGSFVKTYPTPDANMGKRGTQPTWKKQRPSGHHASYTLNQAVRDLEEQKLYPTPMANEARLGYQRRDTGKKGSQQSLTTIVMNEEGEQDRAKSKAKLSPAFVEYLMGFPTGWTNPDISNEQLISMNTEQRD